METRIDLLRHGEVQGGVCYRGITDDALTDLGWQQMQAATVNQQWDVVISSPLKRCFQFAGLLAQNLSIPLIEQHGLMEIDFGDWEGLSAAEIDKQLLAQFYANPEQFTPPNAESFLLFKQRILNAWQVILQAYVGQKILVITHAGVIRVLLAQLLELGFTESLRFDIAHACMTGIKVIHAKDENPFLQLQFHGVRSV